MAKGLREILGAAPSTASTKDSVLVIIDAQNEYVSNLQFPKFLILQLEDRLF